MTDNPAPGGDTADPATASDKADPTMIPKARLDEEIAKRRELEEQVSHMADAMLAAIPEDLKPLIPDGMSPAAKVAWYIRAKETGVFNAKKADVPETDTAKPKTSPRGDQDLSTLPVHARIAAGYAKG